MLQIRPFEKLQFVGASLGKRNTLYHHFRHHLPEAFVNYISSSQSSESSKKNKLNGSVGDDGQDRIGWTSPLVTPTQTLILHNVVLNAILHSGNSSQTRFEGWLEFVVGGWRLEVGGWSDKFCNTMSCGETKQYIILCNMYYTVFSCRHRNMRFCPSGLRGWT